MEPRIKILVENRRSRHEFHLLDSFEAGISLLGSEVKSLRNGRGNLREAFVVMKPGGAWLMQCHISPYTHANRQNHEPSRPRRLLLIAHEITKLRRGTAERGMTIVPVRLYLKGSRVKGEIALAKGKKLHDKRATIKARDAKREIERGRH